MGGEGESRRGIALKLTFPGANPHPRLEPFDRLATHVSSFLGNDPDKWHPDVPVWGGVRYVDLYPNVDLEISSEAGRWSWQLVPRNEAPSPWQGEGWGGGPRLRLEGADALTVDATGRVRATTALGELALPPLRLAGPAPAPLAATTQGDVVTFSADPLAVEPSQPSTFQPAQPSTPADNPDDLLYATFLGGSGSDCDYGCAIAVDGAGAAYVTGRTYSPDFPTTPGAFDPSFNGGVDAFVVKLNAGGTALDYATFLGGSGSDGGYAIAVDGAGAAYVTGNTDSADFPTTPGAFDPSHNGGYDAFVATLNPGGSNLAYTTFLGGSSIDNGYAIAVDGAGAAYVTGETWSTDFPTTPGAFDPSFNGNGDAFVVKLAARGGVCPDFNNSGTVDVADIQAVAARWRQRSGDPGWDPRFDLDGDGDIDMVDVMRVAAQWNQTCP